MIGFIIAYPIIGFFSGLLVGVLIVLYGSEPKDPEFCAALTALFWPGALPMFFFFGVFAVIFRSRGKAK